MSKVAIQGNASGTGTLTIAAPNTNSDRTINLADEAGTLVVNGTSSNVGIGTDSPQRQLVLYKNDSGQTQIQFQNQTTGTGSSDGFGVGLDTQEDGFLWNYEGGDIYFGRASDRFMTLKGSSGEVGIGITSPGATFDVRKDNPPNGRLAVFGSNGTPFTTTASGVPNAVTITRSRIVVASNTTTNLLYGYGGSLALITLTNVSGGADAQYTFLVTHAWSSASVLFTNSYGQNQSTFTFSASTGHLRLNHNHSSSIQANINSLIVPGPGAG